MKQKYLLGMLLGGAMLTACSVEDDLNPAKVAQEVNPEAPVFALHFDDNGDGLTRAHYANGKVGFDNGDLLTLYHGIENLATIEDYENAIYKGEEDGEAFKFTTKAMVKKGKAILVWPADTTFANFEKAPVIKISNIQADTTSKYTPYMTEFLEINTYKDPSGHDAGYGRQYDIYMKRAASTLSMTLNIDETTKPELPAGVNDIKVVGVKLYAEATGYTAAADNKASAKAPFTTEIEIKGEAAGETYKGKAHEKTWVGISNYDLNTAKGYDNISTRDVKNNVATFTMLPSEVSNNTAAAPTTRLSNGEITVNTNYGKVVINDESGEKFENPKEGKYVKVTDGLNFVDGMLWGTPKATSTFAGSKIGFIIPLTVKVDLSNISMDGLHIENEDNLKDVLLVYEKLSLGKEVTFILDGSFEEGADKGKFVMGRETWQKVEEALKNEQFKISFALCTEEAPCSAVVLRNEDGTTEEVPELQFVSQEEETSAAVTIELDGDWTYSSVTTNPNTAEEGKDKSKNLNGVAVLDFTKGTLELQNYIAATKDEYAEAAATIVVEKDVTVTVTKIVNLQMNMKNHGTVNIPAVSGVDTRLAVNGEGVVLENCAAQGLDAKGWSETYTGGVINNSDGLVVVSGSGGVINNYGTINVNSTDATTLISSNQTADASLTKLFTNEEQAKAKTENTPGFEKHGDKPNLFGTIVLCVANVQGKNLTVQGTNQQGFIKTFETKTNDQANYLVITENGTNKSYTKANKVVYIELQNSVLTTLKGSITGLIVPEGKRVYVGSGDDKLTVDKDNGHAYVKGTVTAASQGQFNIYKDNNEDRLEGYFGGDKSTDWENIFSNL